LSFFSVDFNTNTNCSLDVLVILCPSSKVEHIRPEQSKPAFEVPQSGIEFLYFLKPAESIDPENRD
jgi:hypothetical protein